MLLAKARYLICNIRSLLDIGFSLTVFIVLIDASRYGSLDVFCMYRMGVRVTYCASGDVVLFRKGAGEYCVYPVYYAAVGSKIR